MRVSFFVPSSLVSSEPQEGRIKKDKAKKGRRNMRFM